MLPKNDSRIHYNKLSKFILLSLMMMLTIYILSILKGAKDTIIVSKLGAELISTLKLFGVLPIILLVTMFYTKLTDYFTKAQVYHLLNFIFITFFILFDLVLYPNASRIHFDFTELIHKNPFFKYQLIMIANWSYSLFYIMSELWGSVMFGLMFWQIANQINSVIEAKKLYPLFGLLGELGLIASGIVMALFTSPAISSDWDTSLHYICLSVFVVGALLSIIFYILSHHVIGTKKINGAPTSFATKPSMMQSIKQVLQSKYIKLITLMLICYGLSINLIEVVWKKQMSILYPNSIDYGHFIAKVQILIGSITIIALLTSSFLLPRLSWHVAALITPIVFIITGVPFFLFTLYGDIFSEYSNAFGYSILFLSVLFGAAQNILGKVTKYSFFEPTKEMLYIPLSEELKTKGKGVADIAGERMGKSSGSVVQWCILSVIGGSTLITIAPFLFVVFLGAISLWTFSVSTINKELKNEKGSIR